MSSSPLSMKARISSANGRGWIASSPARDRSTELLGVPGQAEEPVRLGDPLHGGVVLGAAGDFARLDDQLVVVVEPLAADAVVTFVRALVEVAVGGARPPQPFDCGTVAGIGARAQEVVEGHAERVGEVGEAPGVGVDVHVCWNPRRFGGEDVLEGVVVGAAEQSHVVAGESPRPGVDVGLDQFVGVAEMRFGVDVGNGDGDVRRAHRGLLGWVGDCPAGADSCRPRRQLQGRTESLVRWRSRPRKGPHHHGR